MNLKIVFMGTPPIASVMLKRILADGYDVVGVVTQPDKKVGRKQVLSMSAVKEVALAHNIPVFQPLKIKEDYQAITALDIDLIVTCAYGQFVPETVLQYPTYGSINAHASLLPKLRGGAPIHKAIINGDHETGMSVMRMVKKMDAGAVMAQCRVPITQLDTTGDLYDKLGIAGSELLSQSIKQIEEGSAVFVEQNEEEATFAYTISKEEECIDFSKPLQKVYDQIRGLVPFPVGYALLEGKKIKFHKASMKPANHTCAIGELVGMMDGYFAIACLGGYLLLEELQLEGKAKVDAKSFYNGNGKNLVGHILSWSTI